MANHEDERWNRHPDRCRLSIPYNRAFNGAPKTRAFFDAVGGTFDGILSDLPNAVHEGYDFAKGVATAGGNAFLDWLDESSAPEIAHGAGKVVGNYAALEGVGKFVEVGVAASGTLIKGSRFAQLADTPAGITRQSNVTENGTLTNVFPQDLAVQQRPARTLVQDESGRY